MDKSIGVSKCKLDVKRDKNIGKGKL